MSLLGAGAALGNTVLVVIARILAKKLSQMSLIQRDDVV
jgi:hypothetical protein